MIADCFSIKVSFKELCLIFYLSVYPMACKNDVIVLMQRKSSVNRSNLRDKTSTCIAWVIVCLRPTVYITKVGNKRYWHPYVTSCKREACRFPLVC